MEGSNEAGVFWVMSLAIYTHGTPHRTILIACLYPDYPLIIIIMLHSLPVRCMHSLFETGAYIGTFLVTPLSYLHTLLMMMFPTVAPHQQLWIPQNVLLR
jgi:hypothetical protein